MNVAAEVVEEGEGGEEVAEGVATTMIEVVELEIVVGVGEADDRQIIDVIPLGPHRGHLVVDPHPQVSAPAVRDRARLRPREEFVRDLHQHVHYHERLHGMVVTFLHVPP